MRRSFPRLAYGVVALAVAGWLNGCDDDTLTIPTDTGVADARTDSHTDGGPDATVDSTTPPTDTSPDQGADTHVDSADTAADSTAMDGGIDSTTPDSESPDSESPDADAADVASDVADSGPGPNLVDNPGFESEAGISGWTAAWTPTSLPVTAAAAHSGTMSLEISALQATYKPLTGLVMAGKTYQVWGYARLAVPVVPDGGLDAATDASDDADGAVPELPTSVHFTLKQTCAGADGGARTDHFTWAGNPITLTTTAWTKIGGSVSIPSDCVLVDAVLYLERDTTLNTTSVLYLDDVEVR